MHVNMWHIVKFWKILGPISHTGKRKRETAGLDVTGYTVSTVAGRQEVPDISILVFMFNYLI
jgi:hypothetical protein